MKEIDALIEIWQREAAERQREAEKYSPRGARQAYLRGEASALESCAQALKSTANGTKRKG